MYWRFWRTTISAWTSKVIEDTLTSLCLQISILHSDINAPKDELEQNFFVLDENFHTVFWGLGVVEESWVKTLIWNFLGFSKIIPSKFVRITIYLVFSPSGTLWLDSPVMVTGTKIFRGQSVLPPFIQQYLLELLKWSNGSRMRLRDLMFLTATVRKSKCHKLQHSIK